ncbi:hypothetical protein V6N12_042754 [Hibiscus sabdariffa]|uniref:AP2/ERF domain-containing protein n=1 Tax=Hibiscus sabdariffa TaxID=183260 RepID=A0ABR2AZW7_9ROSI
MESQNPSKNQTSIEPESFKTRSNRKVNGGRRYLGVRERPSGRWVAEIKNSSSQKLRLWLGTFDKAEEAALAYDAAARVLRGKNAKTNFQYQDNRRNLIGMVNPRVYQLLQLTAMKNHARSAALRSINGKMGKKSEATAAGGSSDTVVEETIFCSSSSSESSDDDNNNNNKLSKVSLGNSKESASSVCESVLLLGHRMVEDFQVAVNAGRLLVSSSAVIHRVGVRWEAPPFQWCKLNVDGACDPVTGRASCVGQFELIWGSG